MNSALDNSPLQIFYEKIHSAFPEQKALKAPPADISLREFWHALSAQLHLPEKALAQRVATLASVPEADLSQLVPGLLGKYTYAKATRDLALPLRKEAGALVVAVANPFDLALQQNLSFMFGQRIAVEVATPGDIEIAIARVFEQLDKTRRDQARLTQGKTERQISDREIPRLAQQLLVRAANMKASDIHIQPFIGGSAVRVRVDGLLRRLVILPDPVATALIRYFKAQGKMDPTNNLIPQDGRMTLEADGKEFDLRLSTLPVAGHQEKLVVRLLNRGSVLALQDSGMATVGIHTLRRMASAPSGVILLCGPTGSGKTTTLYSVLSELNEEHVSIATVENPVEYNMAGLSQTEVNAKAGMTFAAALRSILRQDPDIILIGEIRDSETAQIAVQSAMTGHLVFSTLHTNEAVTAIPRLLDLGIAPPVLAEALTGVVSQRLLRRLCEACRERVREAKTPEELTFQQITHTLPGYRAVGCEQCGFTGYKGRLAVTEMIEINNQHMELIAAGKTSSEALLAACDKDFTPITIAAARRIVSGDTSIIEVNRVLGRGFWLDLAREHHCALPNIGSISFARGDEGANALGVMLVGPAGSFDAQYEADLDQAWFKVHRAETPDQAKATLQQHNDIEFVVVSLPGTLTDQGVIDYVADYRVAMAWSRLPALLLVPDQHPEWQKLLIEHGATSRFEATSTPVSTIAAIINAAVTSHQDFRWGKS